MRKRKTYKLSDGRFGFTFSVKTLLNKFKELDINFKDPPKPPKWVNIVNLFGPYLAGLIDADGSVCIKRPKYPQCKVKITSGHPQNNLKLHIEKHLNCKASIEEVRTWNKKWNIWNHGFNLVFLISSRNLHIFKQHILPYIQIPRKRRIIEKYIKIFDNCHNSKGLII